MNKMNKINRRKFIQGIAASSLATTLPSVSFAGGHDNYSDNILIFVFLRGAMDGLSFLTPMDGHPDRGHYRDLRTNGTRIPSNQLLSVGEGFGLHPAASELQEMYQQNDLAIVRACGLPSYAVNRSHFEAERFAELGVPNNRSLDTGWLTRHLATATNYPASIPLPAISIGKGQKFSLLNETTAVSLTNPNIFDLFTPNRSFYPSMHNLQEGALADIYGIGNDFLDAAGEQTLAAIDVVKLVDFDSPVSNGAQYPNSDLGDHFKMMAQLIKQETGVRIGQIDRGGWDTHINQGTLDSNTDGSFYKKVGDISQAFKAFFTDLEVTAPGSGTWADRTTMLVCSEFGRRAFDNANAGTDHGWANVSLVMGGGVNGGQQYGQWPGLASGDLFQGADLRGTVDYRSVWTEILLKRLNNNQIKTIFPGFLEQEYDELGVVSGSSIRPEFDELIFRNGFE